MTRIKLGWYTEAYLPECWDFDPLYARRHCTCPVRRKQPECWTTGAEAGRHSCTAGEAHSCTVPCCWFPYTPATEQKLMWRQTLESLRLLDIETRHLLVFLFWKFRVRISARKHSRATDMFHSFFKSFQINFEDFSPILSKTNVITLSFDA
jgi:hypothetical protein